MADFLGTRDSNVAISEDNAGRKVLILSFVGFKLVNIIYFSLIAIFLLYQFINIDIDMLRDK